MFEKYIENFLLSLCYKLTTLLDGGLFEVNCLPWTHLKQVAFFLLGGMITIKKYK